MRHRAGVYCCDCDCPSCRAQRKAILLGSNAALALEPDLDASERGEAPGYVHIDDSAIPPKE